MLVSKAKNGSCAEPAVAPARLPGIRFTGRPRPNSDAARGKRRLVFGFVQPIWRPAVVKVELVFILSSNRHGLGVLRAVLDGFPGEADADFRFRPAHPFNPRRRN